MCRRKRASSFWRSVQIVVMLSRHVRRQTLGTACVLQQNAAEGRRGRRRVHRHQNLDLSPFRNRRFGVQHDNAVGHGARNSDDGAIGFSSIVVHHATLLCWAIRATSDVKYRFVIDMKSLKG